MSSVSYHASTSVFCLCCVAYYVPLCCDRCACSKEAQAILAQTTKMVTVHSVTSNTLHDAQKSCKSMISRRMSRVFCDLRSQKTPRGTVAVNSN